MTVIDFTLEHSFSKPSHSIAKARDVARKVVIRPRLLVIRPDIAEWMEQNEHTQLYLDIEVSYMVVNKHNRVVEHSRLASLYISHTLNDAELILKEEARITIPAKHELQLIAYADNHGPFSPNRLNEKPFALPTPLNGSCMFEYDLDG